jgi:hypothetical protein
MIAGLEDAHNSSKPELDSTALAIKPEQNGSRTAMYPPPPIYAHHQGMYQTAVHELPTSLSSPVVQPSELSSTRDTYTNLSDHAPADGGPAVMVPAPHMSEEDVQLKQLRNQRAAVARDRERKEEIDRMRAEEERLNQAIAELESRRLRER